MITQSVEGVDHWNILLFFPIDENVSKVQECL